MKFKLLAGQHVQAEPDPAGKKDRDGNPVMVPVVYRQGDVVESDAPLDKKHGPDKFAKLDDNPRYVPADSLPKPVPGESRAAGILREYETEMGLPLENLTPEDLKDFAKAEKINLSGAKSKDDMVKIVRDWAAKAD
ncbi:MAG: hypothetical protein ACRC7O_04475 [Fimbriiglobus sp.]